MSTGDSSSAHATDINDFDAQVEEMEIEADEEDMLTQGRACFDSKEFLHAAHILSKCASMKGQFLGLYARYLVRVYELLIIRIGSEQIVWHGSSPVRNSRYVIGIKWTVRLFRLLVPSVAWKLTKTLGDKTQPTTPLNPMLVDLRDYAFAVTNPDPWIVFM